MSSRGLAVLMLAALACGGAEDPIATKCKPHRERELACAPDDDTRKALRMVGDMCQKVLNGKNTHVFGPTSVKRMEADLACAVANTDCAAYAACTARVEGADGDDAAPTLPR